MEARKYRKMESLTPRLTRALLPRRFPSSNCRMGNEKSQPSARARRAFSLPFQAHYVRIIPVLNVTCFVAWLFYRWPPTLASCTRTPRTGSPTQLSLGSRLVTGPCYGTDVTVGGVLIAMHGRRRLTIDPRIPTVPEQRTWGFHRPGRHYLHHQARSET